MARSRYHVRVKVDATNHYVTLGLARGCSDAQIRDAYRALARKHHPDLNPGSAEAIARTQALNAAYEVLSDAARRLVHDAELERGDRKPVARRAAVPNLMQDVQLTIQELLCGTSLTVRVDDPASPEGVETLELAIPPGTAPGTRFRLQRMSSGGRGVVMVRVKARPDFRFKARGSDLRCDLKISARRALQGGSEALRGVAGTMVHVRIPANVLRGEIVRVAGEGLPRPRGGRGDLLVRIVYRPDVTVSRGSRFGLR